MSGTQKTNKLYFKVEDFNEANDFHIAEPKLPTIHKHWSHNNIHWRAIVNYRDILVKEKSFELLDLYYNYMFIHKNTKPFLRDFGIEKLFTKTECPFTCLFTNENKTKVDDMILKSDTSYFDNFNKDKFQSLTNDIGVWKKFSIDFDVDYDLLIENKKPTNYLKRIVLSVYRKPINNLYVCGNACSSRSIVCEGDIYV